MAIKVNRYKTDTLFLLEELTQRLHSAFDQLLNQHYHISYSEWKLLFAIFLAQDNPTQENIAFHAQKTAAAVSRQLLVLEQKELVERSESKNSKRIKLVRLSKQGRNVFSKSLLMIGKLSKQFFRQIGDDAPALKENAILLLEYLDQHPQLDVQ